jgi:hypothetical protein
MAQHPVDGRVWAFIKADSSYSIVSIVLKETGRTLVVDSTDGYFLSTFKPGQDMRLRPHPELPALIATSDPFRKTILLGYQSAIFSLFPFGGFSSGAYITLAQISEQGLPSVFAHLQIPVERAQGFRAVSISSSDVSLVYLPFDTSAQKLSSSWQVSSFANGQWGAAYKVPCQPRAPIRFPYEKAILCSTATGIQKQEF